MQNALQQISTWMTANLLTSVVTVLKCFLSVGFSRFCRKKPRFSVRFRFLW